MAREKLTTTNVLLFAILVTLLHAWNAVIGIALFWTVIIGLLFAAWYFTRGLAAVAAGCRWFARRFPALALDQDRTVALIGVLVLLGLLALAR